MKQELEKLIAKYKIKNEDANWLRSLAHQSEQRNELLMTMTYLKANLSPSTSRQIDCVVAIQSALDKCKEK